MTTKATLRLSDCEVGAGIAVRDMKRARQFYEGVLGLKPGNVGSDQGVSYVCGGHTAIHVYPSAGAGKAEHTQAGWLVPDLDAAVDSLTAQGVRFEQYHQPPIVTDAKGIASFPDGRVAYFKDPDGNIMSLNQA
jgi:catechol 2,3-dioxygenase-like lactoylglutathione lyase family enzyme